jgi:hypothetical protein
MLPVGPIHNTMFVLCVCVGQNFVKGGALRKKGPTQTQTHKHWVMCLVMGARLCVCVFMSLRDLRTHTIVNQSRREHTLQPVDYYSSLLRLEILRGNMFLRWDTH